MSTPTSPSAEVASAASPQAGASPSPAVSAPTPLTRTVAIIKNHGLSQRFEVERRIQDARFEIVKERQMEFDLETDPEFMEELFGEDVHSLAEGAVWVYVLERKRAVETWQALMGPKDPEVARAEAPDSLRAAYGLSAEKNVVMGPVDDATAELQIASLFASSPPFPTSELPEGDKFGSMRSVSSSVLAELQQVTSNDGSAVTSPTATSSTSKQLKNATNGFKARALPTTHAAPDIAPRTSRAAALRAGIILDKTETGPRERRTRAEQHRVFMDVPGHKRSETIAVASTAAPAIAPRMTRAAALRLGKPLPPAPMKKAASTGTKTGTINGAVNGTEKKTFEGVPGHKRRETISVASVAAPIVAPRTNRSAALRAAKESAPPTSFMFRGPSQQRTPSLSRSSSQTSLRPPSRPTSQASTRPPLSRAPSSQGNVKSTTSNASTKSPSNVTRAPIPRPSSIGAPTIAPRSNKSAELRAAKKAEEEARAAAAAKRMQRASARPTPRPSSIAV